MLSAVARYRLGSIVVMTALGPMSVTVRNRLLKGVASKSAFDVRIELLKRSSDAPPSRSTRQSS